MQNKKIKVRGIRDIQVGREGQTQWPTDLSDITTLNFSFSNYIKDRVFAIPVKDIHTMLKSQKICLVEQLIASKNVASTGIPL